LLIFAPKFSQKYAKFSSLQEIERCIPVLLDNGKISMMLKWTAAWVSMGAAWLKEGDAAWPTRGVA
jgi:hypothetical protein